MPIFSTAPAPVAPRNSRAAEAPKLSHWLQVMSHVSSKFGGIATSVPQLSRASEANGPFICESLAFCDPQEVAEASGEQQAAIRSLPPSRARSLFDRKYRGDVNECIQACSGVHIHGIWEMHSVTASNVARAYKKPYVVSAHGMLDTWSVKQKRPKKALYAALIEMRVLHKASCLRALTATEVNDYRRIGLGNPIAIVPNGVSVPSNVTTELFDNAFPELREKRIALFLGRLHPKKGLVVLLKAWAEMLRTSPKHDVDDAHLVIAGPDSEGTLDAITRLRAELCLEHSVTFAGMLNGENKWSALAAAQLFVLPSYSEGFSVAVLEAMGVGRPVIVSEHCHIPEVDEVECGWTVKPEIKDLRLALANFYGASDRTIAEIGNCGRLLVEDKFSWNVVGRQMAEIYGWLDGGDQPASLDLVL